jgi:uncharacterized protein DUF4440
MPPVVDPAVLKESLLATFSKAVEAFNKHDFDKGVRELLHPDAVLNRIHHRSDADSVREREAVIEHLRENQGQTQFTPGTPSVSIRTGTVSGIGEWKVKGVTEKISYSFIFTYDIEKKDWFLLNMDAALQP